MLYLFRVLFVVLVSFSINGCYIFEEEEDPAIKERDQAIAQAEAENTRHITFLKSKKAIEVRDSDLEPREIDIEGTISALSTDGINIVILTTGGTIYQYNISSRVTYRLFNIKEETLDGENIDLRLAYFLYYSQRVVTVGYYTNQLLDADAKDTEGDDNSSNNSGYVNGVKKYRFRERRYLYESGDFLGEVSGPVEKQNVAKYKQRQYRLDRNSIFQEGLTDDGTVGDMFNEIARKSTESSGKYNVNFVGLTIVNDYAWVGSLESHLLFRIKIKIKDSIDETVDEYLNGDQNK